MFDSHDSSDKDPYRAGLTSDFLNEVPVPIENGGFLGTVIRFKDGSCWKLTKALSKTAYQRRQPPFEARQVFTCVCMKDPHHNYDGIKEAVMKVRYQIRGTEQSVDLYQRHLRISREILKSKKYPLGEKYAQDDFCHAHHMLRIATHPVDTPHEFTKQEIEALWHLRRENCGSTPQLLNTIGDFPAPGVDEQEMVDGYAVFILMTKVPGEPLTYDKYWKLLESERDEIRAAFKEALIEVYNHRICPEDASMRNLLWDGQARKCYIVDFEDYCITNLENGPITFKEYQYEFWELAEKCFTGWT